MPKEVIHRTASDNKYLHKDFHGALSVGLDYLQRHYGDESVREYLRQFARTFYAPLTDALGRRGLVALAEHFEKVYADESARVRISLSDDELRIDVEACPAVTHMREHGYPVAPLFHETTRTVNEAICEGTPFAAELLDYDPATGRGTQRFFRRKP
jgi:hypothetical protein